MSRASQVLRPRCGHAVEETISPVGPVRPELDQRRGTLLPIQRDVTTKMRRKDRRDFVALLASSAVTIAVMVTIWAVTGAGSFWPIWVIFGLSVVLLGSACRVFSPQRWGKRDDADRQPDRN